MKPRTLIVLAVVALSLGSYVLWVEGDQHTSDELRMQRRRVVSGLDRDKVTGITIKRQGKTITLRRLGDARWQVGPWRADPALVDQILSGVEFLEHVRTVPEGSDRQRMGLTSPGLVLTFNRGDRPKIQLSIGRRDPSGQGVYLEYGSRVVVVAASFRAMLQRDPGQLRDRELMPLTGEQILEIQLRHQGRDYSLQPRGKGWIISMDRQRVRADPRRVGKLLMALRSLRAARFPDLVTAAGAEPWITVRGKSITISIRRAGQCPGRPTERLVYSHERDGSGKRQPAGQQPPASGLISTACVPTRELTALEVAPPALMDLAPISLSAAQLARVEIRRGGRALVLRRDGGRWLLGKNEPAGADRVRNWAAALGALKGTLRSPGAQGEVLDQARVTLLSESKVTEVLELGKAAAGQVPALRRADGAALWFPEKILSLLRPDPLEFRRRQVLALSALDVVLLSCTTGGRTQDFPRTKNGWKDRAMAATLDRVVAQLASLQVQRFLAAAPAMTSPLSLSLTLAPRALKAADAAPPTTRIVTLTVGAADASGGCPGVLDGEPPVWLSPSVCKVLTALAAPAR